MINYLTKEEVKRLFKVIKKARDKAIFTISYWRGLRVSEVGMLRMSSFRTDDLRPNLTRLEITRLKNSVGGDYLLNPDETRVMKAWLRVRGSKPGPIFASNRGRGISRQQLDKLMRAYGADAGIPVEKRHFHVLKHSIATHLHEAGIDVLKIQRWLGHRNINSTVKYLHQRDAGRDELGLAIFEQF